MSKTIVLNVGLHKTGSTSLQELLKKNRSILSKEVHCLIHDDPKLVDLQRACKVFDRHPTQRNKKRLTTEWKKVLEYLKRESALRILISSEDLLGWLPKPRAGRSIYQNSATIISTLCNEVQDYSIEVVAYKRSGREWVDSLYRHLVRKGVTKLSGSEFHNLPDFKDGQALQDRIMSQIEAASGRKVTCLEMRDDVETRLGPGDGLLKYLGLSKELTSSLTPVCIQNQGIDSATAESIQELTPDWLPIGFRRTYVRRLVRKMMSA